MAFNWLWLYTWDSSLSLAASMTVLDWPLLHTWGSSLSLVASMAIRLNLIAYLEPSMQAAGNPTFLTGSLWIYLAYGEGNTQMVPNPISAVYGKHTSRLFCKSTSLCGFLRAENFAKRYIPAAKAFLNRKEMGKGLHSHRSRAFAFLANDTSLSAALQATKPAQRTSKSSQPGILWPMALVIAQGIQLWNSISRPPCKKPWLRLRYWKCSATRWLFLSSRKPVQLTKHNITYVEKHQMQNWIVD